MTLTLLTNEACAVIKSYEYTCTYVAKKKKKNNNNNKIIIRGDEKKKNIYIYIYMEKKMPSLPSPSASPNKTLLS